MVSQTNEQFELKKDIKNPESCATYFYTCFQITISIQMNRKITLIKTSIVSRSDKYTIEQEIEEFTYFWNNIFFAVLRKRISKWVLKVQPDFRQLFP